ncbi:PAS domain S-box-containing protein [Cupriavidus sp. OV038]|uniref:trifunctional serine/threonine-protein kinase/ATP-binding protein/sensor histidine kinase n=1 Tax=unclassified Cupriavidus TaxID=2640874 RepID=UPI0008E3F25C|nr:MULTISPECIES: AAA family ATPase [unclassified Cupriavidus]SFC44294.1 PAS domain S-box-containing protein [Cupriavidus sp. OV038]SFP32839.1 PAS domain S-box-containing protein [Cupriavidus sp. OV096]
MHNGLQILWDDGERVFYRGRRPDEAAGDFLLARPAAEQPLPASLDRLAHEYRLKDELDSAWAIRPLELVREAGRTALMLEDPGGEPLSRLLGAPMEIGAFLRHAVSIATALCGLHQRGLLHKDLKPTHIVVNCADGQARLTGFGLASRLPRERQAPKPPETIAGTLAYMAPEQTGRMNRSIDSRSDLYAFGVTLYQMLTGALPFTATDPMEWVHCHIAKMPVSPRARQETVPATISRIVMKLLAKMAEERYETAVGLEHDLRQCLEDWERQRRIEDFPLDAHGTHDRLLIPEKLYGRECEVSTLVDAFTRVVETGTPELVLVSGYSGIGKSSVVSELHRVLVPPRGLFASGKFDQYKRDIPYSTLVQAFQGLVRMLLGKSDAELERWRSALLEALGPNAGLMTDLIPELKLIIGEPPPVPELEPQQAQRRFLLVFRAFIGAFARPEHPLALFLDDLQWLDAATLDLMEDLLTHADMRHLLLVGAYRDNEVGAAHPLTGKLQAIRNAGARVDDIQLAPLASAHIRQLLAEALHGEPARIEPLAQLVHDKTAGNPFFVIRFLHALVDEDLLTPDHATRQWRWDPARIHAKGYTDNVVDLLVGKLAKLPLPTQQALQQLSCLGNVAEITTLAAVLGMPEAQVHTTLWEAIRQELVIRQETTYAFVHDRVHEAAYTLIPEASRAEAHLRIGRLLAARTLPAQRDEAIFEIVGQLNRGTALITDAAEREQLAEFNLLAGQRAKASTAYASALTYLGAGAGLLPENGWQDHYDLMFALESNRAQCEFLTGQLAAAEARFMTLAERAVDVVERLGIACWQMDLYLILGQGDRAVSDCLALLRLVGIEWSPQPDESVLRHEYDRIWSLLGDRPIETLIDLPPMEDPVALATIQALAKLSSPALHTARKDGNLAWLTICKAISLSLEHGNTDASCVAYTNVARVAGRIFGDYQAGFQFGELGCQLAERRGLKRYEPRTYLSFSVFVARWSQPVRTCGEQLQRAFDAAHRVGDVPSGAFTRNNLVSNLLFAGEPLPALQDEAERGVAYARQVRFGIAIGFSENQLALIRMLRGITPTFGYLDGEHFSESLVEPGLSLASPVFACWYWIRKLQARYFAGDLAAAMDAAAHAKALLWSSYSFLEEAEYYFYGALARAGLCDALPAGDQQSHLDILADHHRELQVWADLCPQNFASHAALVGAEIARIEGREIDAELRYEQAIHAARDDGFVNIEALANELASRFYAARGFQKIARSYLRDARYSYLRWGADGKARHLEAQHPYLRSEASTPGATNTMATSVEQLDLATVIKVTQAASGEIVLEKLIDMILRTALEQAGAERGLLILSEGGEQRMAAEATSDATRLHPHNVPVSAAMLPASVLNHVMRTREPLFLDDAVAEPLYAADPYIHQHRARSILCVPLMTQAKLTGALYLENNLAARVFSPSRIAVLRLVASQAAISLENARLYRDVAEREAKIRRLVEANIIGIAVWRADGGILEANDAFLRMVGYARADLVSGHIGWRDLTPPDRQQDTDRAAAALIQTGRVAPLETEYLRKDGSRIPVIVGLATFEPGGRDGVAFVLDLTEQKQAEDRVREGERRYREVQTELAHANRVATMGQLAASIAHEVNQPIAATVTNAQAATRWLNLPRPDLDEVGFALTRIVKDANRAADVLGRIRQLIRKAPRGKELVDINAAIREVVELTGGEARKSRARVETQLAHDLPLIEGERVALQQVLLNLIVNAIEAMLGVDGERHVLIATRCTADGCVLVTVRDSGPGFGSLNPDSIFAPFYTTKSTGLGMGLSICRSIIEAHGGRLWASENAPHGAVIQFTVPTQAGEP